MKYFIKTFGCQANKSDSERIAGDYQSRGFTETKDWHKANEIVINTCAVRQRAEDRVGGFLKNITDFFGENRPKIILTGCMTYHGRQYLSQKYPHIDEILPVGEVGFNYPSVRKDKIRAFVPISTGCNSFCTYCVVPYARGAEKSRNMDEIISEVRSLVDSGYKQVTLLGQNVNSYGLEKTNISVRKLRLAASQMSLDKLPTNQSQYLTPTSTPPFVELLQKLSAIDGLNFIDFFTSNPWDFWDELIDEVGSNKKISRFIHLPVQSGSDRILRLMNRGYTSKDYLDLVEKIKTKIPDAVFGTDIIVGFPGETDDDFQDTVRLAKSVGFQIAFVAQYSPRPGTVSDRLYPDDIPSKVKKHRWNVLEDLINKPALATRPDIP